MKRLAASVALLLLARGVQVAAAPSPPDPPANAWRFDWSPPCQVPIRDRAEKKGKTGHMGYTVDVRPSARDGVLEVRFLNLQILEVNGQDVTGPEWRSRLEATTRATADAMPTLLVSQEGRYLGLEGYGAILDLVQKTTPDSDKPEVAAFMRSARAQDMVTQKVGDTWWRSWVEAWLDWTLAPGTTEDMVIPYPLPGGGTVEVPLRAEHLGVNDGYARLQLTWTMGGPAFSSLLLPLVQDLIGTTLTSTQVEALMRDAQMVTQMYVETAPGSLRPRTSRVSRDVVLTVGPGGQHVREVHEVTWDWSAAVGCGR